MALAQQIVLRDAMRRLALTRDAFAARLEVKRRTLDSWLIPSTSVDARTMPGNVRLLVEHVLHEAGLAAATIDPASSPGFGGERHLLSVSQFDRAGLERLFRVSDVMQPFAARQKVTRVLEGAVLANMFFEASTRTRLSFGAAFARLGGAVLDTTGVTFSSMAKGESIADTSRVVAGYADAIVVRHPDEGSVAEFAAASNVPVLNAGDGIGEHPSQALLDVYTVQREFSFLGKQIDGATIAVLGDLRNGRTVHSLVRLLALHERMTFRLYAPPSLELPAELEDHLRILGHRVVTSPSAAEAVTGADVVYTTRIQRERMRDEADLSGYRIDRTFLDRHVAADALVMHPLPRDSRPGAADLATDLAGDPRVAIFRQTDNGIAVRMAVFAEALGVSHLVDEDTRPTTWFVPARYGVDDLPLLSDA
ncbi:aspartate carbamoyltransferase [Curtobacterium sp. RRHDQ10]|uniref:aspartate carbamoyltransferase n=1 Tax=Curtobacterium phyllosphaerae TaxID=3413379 RepID=UPI003BF3A246